MTEEIPMAPWPFHLMAKPVGPACNMACRYCFYREKTALVGSGSACMSEAVLDAYIRGVAAACPGPELTYAWQGGEPTLAGVEFYRKAVALEARYAKGRAVANAFQTNGLLLDDAWCEFFAANRFLVGLSVDGPAQWHDRYRVDAGGHSRFGDVLKAIALLKKHGAEFNTLTVVNAANVGHGVAVYRFLRDIGSSFHQYIPLVEREPDGEAKRLGLELAGPPDHIDGTIGAPTAWSVRPDPFGGFLSAVFDEWIRRDVGRVYVQTFETLLAQWLGLSSPVCQSGERCGRALVLERDGDVYACDHYVYPSYRRGNILVTPLREMVASAEQIRFGNDKADLLPEVCLTCKWLHACRGGCPKHRFAVVPGMPKGVNYLCRGYQRFFRHAAPSLDRMAALLRARRPAADIMSERTGDGPIRREAAQSPVRSERSTAPEYSENGH